MRESEPPRNKTLSVAAASAFLAIDPKTLRKWTDDGAVQAIRVPPRGDRRYTLEELERVRQVVMQPDTLEEYGGYILRPHPGITADGRFGRCWIHVYGSEADETADKRAFALVLLVHHDYIRRRGRQLDVMALQEARHIVHAMVEAKTFKRGILYRLVITRGGLLRTTEEVLRDDVYE